MSRPTTPASTAYGNTTHSTVPTSYLGSEKPGLDGDHMSGAVGHEDTLPHDVTSAAGIARTDSRMSRPESVGPSKSGTLKKKASVRRGASLKRSSSRRSSYAGSVRSLRVGEKEKYESTEEQNSAFYCPVPLSGSPTELLADRFQAWRKVLKDLINYFRDLQKASESRSKTLLQSANVISNTSIPSNFLTSGGLGDALHVLHDFHKQAVNENNKARELENEVILQLTGLRSDLQQKIKEIKSLSGDFKNSVQKEQEGTKKAVRTLQESLGSVDHDSSGASGKSDPFLVKMAVDRQLEKQIEEENYLHRAYLNLEASGRELESIVVGEIQKAYNVLAGVLRRDADQSYDTAEKLREGPLAMPKDYEWDNFVTTNEQMVDPRHPLREVEHITYNGKNHPAAIEVRSGMLERKSKYLKNYTPGWYILSPTHLHEFKSADRISAQTPVMSLYLPDQKLGSQSDLGSSSAKFMLKGRQTGTMHRGHSWIFRAETHDTMTAWYADIKELTEKRGEARNDFVRRTHARSMSGSSMRAPSVASGDSAMEEDEADRVAFSGEQSVRGPSVGKEAGVGAAGVAAGAYAADDGRSEAGWRPPKRPTPGGRFPSDLNVQRGLQAPLSPSSEGNSPDERERDTIAAAGALPGSALPLVNGPPHHSTGLQENLVSENDKAGPAVSANTGTSYTTGQHPNIASLPHGADMSSTHAEWMAPVAAGAGGAAIGAGAVHASQNHHGASENTDEQMANGAANAGHPSVPAVNAGTADAQDPASHSRGLTQYPEATGRTGTGLLSNTASTTATSLIGSEASTQVMDTDSLRPGIHSAKSVQTISDLHIPGEFPKSTVT